MMVLMFLSINQKIDNAPFAIFKEADGGGGENGDDDDEGLASEETYCEESDCVNVVVFTTQRT